MIIRTSTVAYASGSPQVFRIGNPWRQVVAIVIDGDGQVREPRLIRAKLCLQAGRYRNRGSA